MTEMKLRGEIEPNMELAEKLYPEILRSILDYTKYCDEQGDKDNTEYKKLEKKFHDLTNKDMSVYNLREWWEEEGAEVLAFRIALPDAVKLPDINREELNEIVRRVATFDIVEGLSFKAQFNSHLDVYYHTFLKLNFKKYKPIIFQAQRDENRKYFEYEMDEISELLWEGGMIKEEGQG